jgi:hypothetical protein
MDITTHICRYRCDAVAIQDIKVTNRKRKTKTEKENLI